MSVRAVILYSVVTTILTAGAFVALNAALPSQEGGVIPYGISPFLGTMGLMLCAGALEDVSTTFAG
jgi:hypothetical protein